MRKILSINELTGKEILASSGLERDQLHAGCRKHRIHRLAIKESSEHTKSTLQFGTLPLLQSQEIMKLLILGSLAVLAMLHVVCSTHYPDEDDLQSIQDLVDQLQRANVEQEVPDYKMENGNVDALLDQLALEQGDGDGIASEEKFSWKNLWRKIKRAFHRKPKHKNTYHSLRRGCAVEQADDETPVGYEQETDPQEAVDALLNQLQQQMAQEQDEGDVVAKGERCMDEQAELQDAYETLAQLQQIDPGLADEQSDDQLHQDMEAVMEGWWSKVKNWGKKAYRGAKKGCSYVPLENQNMAETEFLGTAYTVLKGACKYVNGGQVSTEGLFGFSLSDLKRKGKQLLGYARTGCKKYGQNSGTVKKFSGDKTRYLDLICHGLNGSQPAVAQLFLTNAVRAVVEDKEQAAIEQSAGRDLIRSFAN